MKKRLIVTDKDGCMACLSCMYACSGAFYKVDDITKSCIQIVGSKKDANKADVKVCLQCGKCMRTCTHDAITQNPKTGVFMINKKKCTGCGDCVKACPMQVMVLPEEIEPKVTSKCIACGICAKACPAGILEVQTKE